MELDFDHHIFTSAGCIKQICQPLKKHLDISYFNFVRVYPDQSQVCLTSDPEWTKFFYQKQLYKHIKTFSGKIGNTILTNSMDILSWQPFQELPILIEQKRFSGINIGLCISLISESYTEFIHFGTHYTNTHLNDVYLANADLLITFINTFNHKAKNIIKKASLPENLIRLPYNTFQPKTDFTEKKIINIKQLQKEIEHTKIYICAEDHDSYLTPKELRCIKMLCYGLTSKEIAEQSSISQKTVEKHIENAKIRLNVSSKSELLRKIYTSLPGWQFFSQI